MPDDSGVLGPAETTNVFSNKTGVTGRMLPYPSAASPMILDYAEKPELSWERSHLNLLT